MFEVVSFVNNDSKVEVEVMYSVSEQELYIIIVLEKENNLVRIYMNKPEGNEFNHDNNKEIAKYEFASLDQSKDFFDNIKSKSAIEILIFNYERENNLTCQ